MGVVAKRPAALDGFSVSWYFAFMDDPNTIDPNTMARYTSTLLAFLDSVHSRFPGALTESQLEICKNIAGNTGSSCFASARKSVRECAHGQPLNTGCKACERADAFDALLRKRDR